MRAARRELLAGLDPALRGSYADVPILLAGETEFREHGGPPDKQVHLLVEDGRALVLLRDGAPPSAMAGMLPALQSQVFARSGGLTLKGALPPDLRDVTIRRIPDLTTDTVRVVPIPPTGPITGVEVHIGPRAQPIDLALHAGELRRVLRWTGLAGDARTLAARFGNLAGLDIVNPTDRARFEAAGEVGKLAPIIDERVRRWLAARNDPEVSNRIEREISHLLAQQEHARRVLSGELPRPTRGYIAAEGLNEHVPPTVTPGAHATTDPVLRARELIAEIQRLTTTDSQGPRRALSEAELECRNLANILYNRLIAERRATAAELGDRADA